MKIKHSNYEVQLWDVGNGEVFAYDNKFYMMVNDVEANDKYVCVDLESGDLRRFNSGRDVTVKLVPSAEFNVPNEFVFI